MSKNNINNKEQQYLVGEKVYPVYIEKYLAPDSGTKIECDLCNSTGIIKDADEHEYTCPKCDGRGGALEHSKNDIRYRFKCDKERTIINVRIANAESHLIIYRLDNEKEVTNEDIFKTIEEAEEFCLTHVPEDKYELLYFQSEEYVNKKYRKLCII